MKGIYGERVKGRGIEREWKEEDREEDKISTSNYRNLKENL